MKMRKIDIGEIEGFRLGNAENAEAATGVTVIIAEDGAVGGVDVRGGGPATRETDLLKSENTVDRIHAVVLSGGSAFGLEAGSGVMRALAEKGIGFKIDENIVVPIVPGASLYDLTIGRSDVFPDVEMGKEAVKNAYEGRFESGNHGAGTGATVGKYLGYGRAMKTGLGTFACGDDYVQVGAIAAVNAVGDIYNGAGNIIAGLRTTDGSAIKGTIRVLKGMVHDESSPDLDLTDIRTIAASEAMNRTASQTATTTQAEPKSDVHSEEITIDEKEDIVAAMMRSYEQENTTQPTETSEAAAEPSIEVPESVSVSENADESPALLVSEPETVQSFEPEPEQSLEPAQEVVYAEKPSDEYIYAPQETEPAVTEEAPVSASEPEEMNTAELSEPESAEPVTEAAADAVTEPAPDEVSETAPDSDVESEYTGKHSSEYTYAESPAAIEMPVAEQTSSPEDEYLSVEPESQVTGDNPEEDEDEDEDDEFVLTEEDKADMGYDIPFNTTISCVITNAVLTKNQANKLAQILHDAYARAIKPVHGTLDGDTIFVMSTCKVKVNFDAFAALATDVLQYAVIDGAASADGAYGLPAAKDMIHR